VILSFVGTSLFYGEEVSVFLDDADEILVSLVIATVATSGSTDILESSACRASVDIFVDIDELF